MDSLANNADAGRHGGRGQSLVEAALFLPLLVFMIAGLVEVANLLVTQNRVTTASRIAAGYGATYITDQDRNNWTAAPIADAMGDTALNAVTETLELTPELWDIWSIYGVTNDAGNGQADGWAVFTYTQVYGANAVVSDGDWDAMQLQIQADVLAELQAVAGADTANLEVVAAADFHNIDTILGLPVWQWVGVHRIRGLTVMRVSEQPAYAGCPILPITIRLNQWSLYPSNWAGGQLHPTQYPADPVHLIGPRASSQNEFVPPYIHEGTDYTTVNSTTFTQNNPGVPFTDARPGYIYRAREQDPDFPTAGGFGWLDWRSPAGTPDLSASMTYPGNFLSNVYGYPGSAADQGAAGGFFTTDTNTSTGNNDQHLDVGEWVHVLTGNRPVLQGLTKQYACGYGGAYDCYPVVLIYYTVHEGTGFNIWYQVDGFVVVKIIGFRYQGNPNETGGKQILFEFVSWGSECINAET